MNKNASVPTLYREKNRPQFHFSPKYNWLNDPNGMVYYAGKYHLFYQYNPNDKAWGNMSWGHAVSEDLLTWQHRDVAIESDADGLGYIFSGGAVVDWNNTSGLQEGEHPPILAQFTHSSRYDKQLQSTAYSLDGGDVWQVYHDNPIIDNPGIADFRDPKVIWHETTQSWIMALAAGQVIMFYRSSNLLQWEFISEFGEGYGAHGGVWECPDLFPLKVENSDSEKWVLLVSINPGGPNVGSATQYFIGEFDGQQFQHEHSEILWLDYGPDCYAGVTWSDIPAQDGRRIFIAWMTNWLYANLQPSAPWKGAMTIPRELNLINTNHGLRLSSKPVREFESLRTDAVISHQTQEVAEALSLDKGQAIADCVEINLVLDWSKDRSDEWILRFFNDLGEELILDFRASVNELQVDRSKANYKIRNNQDFNAIIKSPLDLDGKMNMNVSVFKDTSSVEVFIADGVNVVTATFFVEQALDKVEIYSGHSNIPIELKSAKLYPLNSIWK